MINTILTIAILTLGLTTGNAHAYLSPGEVFPGINTEENTHEAPVRAIPALENAGVASEDSTIPMGMPYLLAATLAALAAGVLYKRRAPKIASEAQMPPMGEI